MSNQQPESEIVWKGRPWVLPAFIERVVVVVVLAILLTWLEFNYGFATHPIVGVPIWAITYALLLILLALSSLGLLYLKASHLYTLRKSSLEIQDGIVSKKVFTLSSAGFSDLEVIRGVWGRIVNVGTIVAETDSHRDVRLLKVRDPMNVSGKIRDVMTHPSVRIESDQPK